MKPVNVPAKCALFTERWSPKIIAQFNGQEVRVVKLQGEFVWHHHEIDELFFVLEGEFDMHLRDGIVTLKRAT